MESQPERRHQARDDHTGAEEETVGITEVDRQDRGRNRHQHQ